MHPKMNNIILTGLPRSGTTLTCHLLSKVSNTVALPEPMKVGIFLKLLNNQAICKNIDAFFTTTRQSLLTDKTAITKHINGSIPDNTREESVSGRQLRKQQKGLLKSRVIIEKELTNDFFLIIKHPAAFTALLDCLSKHFLCYAIVRNPLSVLASWNSVDMSVAQGHASIAEKLDIHLAQALLQLDEKTDRQIYLLSWFYEQYQKYLPKESILHYENIISSRGKALSAIVPQATELNEFLENKNQNALYDKQLMQRLGEKLLNTEAAFWHFYSKASVEELLDN
jgi:hypothetical protein